MPTFRTSQPASAVDAALPHIVLVGLPGCGKTTVGDLLAKRLGRAFLDFDHEIARRAGMSVAQIFAEHGEHHFRGLERNLTQELLAVGNMILSPGGGWIAQPDAMAMLRPHATMYYLRLRAATALRRMGSKRATRPLLQRPDPLAELERLLEARRAGYESADVTVDVERLNPQQVADRIASLLAGSA